MSIELQTGSGAARPLGAAEDGDVSFPADRDRPNVRGDLTALLDVGPMFRRALAGYDRFQVDTYVRWAEDELAAADRHREQLLARQLETQTALAEARTLMSHSTGGAEFHRVSRRIGSMLASAADDAATIRAEADNHRAVARAQAEVVVADARRTLADAQDEVTRLLAEAAAEVAGMTAEAARITAEAERAGQDVREEAAAHLATARAVEARALEQADRIRRQALDEVRAARLRARDEVVAMLVVGREERRRADAEAAAVRERLEREAADRLAVLRAEVAELERRRELLAAEPGTTPEPAPFAPGALHLRAYLERLQGRLGRQPAPGRGKERTAA